MRLLPVGRKTAYAYWLRSRRAALWVPDQRIRNRPCRYECDLKSVVLSSTSTLDAWVKRTHPGALREILATNLRRMRAERGLTQEALADLSEIDRTYISGIERGLRNLSIDNLERLARALRLEPWQLIRRSDGDR